MLIGESLGGHTAMLVAARHPSLVEWLVVIEASPARAEGVSERVRAFFQANPEAYDAHLDADGAAATVAELDQSDWWDDWRAIRCPVLVVRGEDGNLDAATAAQMAATNPNAEVVVIERAGHDVHLDRPDGLAGVIERFAQD